MYPRNVIASALFTPMVMSVVALAATVSPLSARQESVLPSGAEIRERYIDALGGREALRATKSSHAVGKLEMPAQGLTASMEVFASAPNKLYTSMDMPGVGLITSGFDGEVGWTVNPIVGPMLLEGNNLNQVRQQADFYSVLEPDAYIESFEPTGRAEFEGVPCYEVTVLTTWGEEYVEYYEVETGLLRGNVRKQETAMGSVDATAVIVEYSAFGDILVPTRVIQRAMAMETILTVSSVEYDSVDESLFEIPEEVRVLIEGAPR
jgi:hypothetical protein